MYLTAAILLAPLLQDRWHEGRKIWASVTGASRTLLATLHLSLPPPSVKSPQIEAAQNEAVKELLSLVVAFSYALK